MHFWTDLPNFQDCSGLPTIFSVWYPHYIHAGPQFKMNYMSARGQFELVGHNLIRYEEFSPGSLIAANNVIIPPDDPNDEWTRTLMHMVGEWRAVLRSTYIRWAMAINGLHVAAAKYKSETQPKEFVVTSVRTDASGRGRAEVIAKYSFQEASEAHLKVQAMLCAHGFIDLYAGLEEMVFRFYRTYLWEKPDILLRGPEFASLRKLYRASSSEDPLSK
jgi:predicted GNAT family acetyltransferase